MKIFDAKSMAVAIKKYGGLKAACRAAGRPYGRPERRLYAQAVAEGLIPPLKRGGKSKEEWMNPELQFKDNMTGQVQARETRELPIPDEGVKRYLFTCAQNDTKVHEGFWTNLMAMADHYKADLHVSRFLYIKSGLGAVGDKATMLSWKRLKELQGNDEIWWDEKVEPYLSDDRLEVAPGLVWCGEMNILPTAVRPLSGLEVYTGRKSGIFPHVKIALESVASHKTEPTKFNYTTGTVTLRNYIQRKAGLKAAFNHCYGALLVEVDSDGDWFCRQINADSEGVIYDLDLKFEGGEVTSGHRPEAITWGDIHVSQLENWVADLVWEKGGILDTLKPKWQFFHDVLDFRAQSHHELKDPHKRFLRYIDGETNVRNELIEVSEFLDWAKRDWCENVIVDSNHHHHLGRWLKEQDGRLDPSNAELWVDLQKLSYASIRDTSKVNYLKIGLEAIGADLTGIKLLDEDESIILCHDRSGGIEFGDHGHSGPNGSRGNPFTLARLGRKRNVGHGHYACIVDGVYQSGTFSDPSPDWTKGPSSWSHSFTITYENGKRAILTAWNGKWRA